MNWYVYRRAKGALILILLGIVFLLDETMHWHHVWPFFLIGLGVILLADRFMEPPPPPLPPPGAYPPPGVYPPPYGSAPYSPPAPPPPPENPHT